MIRKVCEYLGFPQEATVYLSSTYQGMERKDLFRRARELFFSEETFRYRDFLEEISQGEEIHRYTVDMMFLLLCAEPLWEQYQAKGISQEIFRDTLGDLRTKLFECKKLHGIWGTSVLWWFHGIFYGRLYALGRLQYEKMTLEYDYKDVAKKGDVVLTCHIPSGSPLPPEEVERSLALAYDFYHKQGEKMLVHCCTWMLYPGHYELFPENSNLRSFYHRFDIVTERETDNLDLWRIFYREKWEDVQEAQLTTLLQKNFYQYLKNGNVMGVGEGILTYQKGEGK